MAHMYPVDGPAADLQSRAEGKLYTMLKHQLGPDYSIVHSTKWHTRDDDGRVQDGEADFVLIHPQHGILVLEVKGGGVYVHGLQRRWYTINAAGKKKQIPNPFDQAMKSMHVLLRTLRRAPSTSPYAHYFRLGYAVWFPDIAWKLGQVGWLQGYDELVLDEHDVRAPEMGLLRIYEHFACVPRSLQLFPPRELTPEAITAVIDLLSPSFEIHAHVAAHPTTSARFLPLAGGRTPVSASALASIPVVVQTVPKPSPLLLTHPLRAEPLHVQFAREEQRFDALTREQYDQLLAVRQHPRLAIPGAAGTGKTVLAMECAWRFAQEGLHVLMLCPDPELAQRIRR